jgi:hypothetical protein
MKEKMTQPAKQSQLCLLLLLLLLLISELTG